MSKRIKSVEFVFENCETLVFNYPDIFMFNIWGEKQSYHSYCNCITLSTAIAGFYAGINKDAKPTEESCLWCDALTDANPTVERMGFYRDVTQLIVEFDDLSQITYHVVWPGDDETSHSGQSLLRTPEGNMLYISTSDTDPHELPSLELVDEMATMACGILGGSKDA